MERVYCRDVDGTEIVRGDLVRRVGVLRRAGRERVHPVEKVLNVTKDGRVVYLESKGAGVSVVEWVSARLVRRLSDEEMCSVLGAGGDGGAE